MANDIYIIDQIVTGSPTITVTDDGSGSDWLSIQGSYVDFSTISLAWFFQSGQSVQASGIYFHPFGSRLVVNGLIENARGSLTDDVIIGNEVANRIYGDQTSGGPGGDDTISAAEGNDSVWGGRGNDVISAAIGDDLLFGGLGNDTIQGDFGLDTIEGGAGADSMAGGSDVGDTLSYANSAAGVIVVLTAGSTSVGFGGDAEGDQIFGFTDVIGTDFSDRLQDSVNGDSGLNANTFRGGLGNDRLVMGGADDVAYGGEGIDVIFGGADDDTLYGGAGDDQLLGGTGADLLFGGADQDRFVFTRTSDSTDAARDRISQFVRGSDLVDLSQIDASTSLAGNESFAFIGSAGFHGVEGELRYRPVASGVLLLADVDGDRKADLSILLSGMTDVILQDLVL